jgi:galactokinase
VYDSHLSLRDDFEVSTRELDTFVETARESGALGARLTGAGFGGCAIALVAASEADILEDFTRRRFEGKSFKEPVFYEFRPVSGAEVAG